MEKMDLLDHKEHQGKMGMMEKLEILVHLEMMDHQEYKDEVDHQENEDIMVYLDIRGKKELQDPLENLDPLDLENLDISHGSAIDTGLPDLTLKL